MPKMTCPMRPLPYIKGSQSATENVGLKTRELRLQTVKTKSLEQ